ncbi:STAS domain-containing protein [Mycobacterium mantenii]|uniref:Sulfate transporter n=1 Tax=Mycobacterium mantenii TaxID=560555 RepID=A0A1A2T559_MYCNT|nr:STAS domain-containing protein [Mycobacterium mantenii]OBH40447.1 sulfate transporter [Mycobacterium mantenii]OBH51359.1 sulfate transporter [Mycobacterium mantenii]OBH71177.1 sulfate transporter [Mycobacterium mantenii]OBH76775.1 sulfate transporter [Mycobacterium mantenii]
MAIAGSPTGHDNCVFDCGRAQVRAHYRHLATVVHIRGEIDDNNVDRISDHIARFTLGENPVVLDVADVDEFAEAGISLLYAFDADCRAAGVDWTLVTSSAVTRVLDDTGHDDSFPIMRSVHEALQDRAEAIVLRRRMALPLVRKTP